MHPGLGLVPGRVGTVGEQRGRVEYARSDYNLKVEVFKKKMLFFFF